MTGPGEKAAMVLLMRRGERPWHELAELVETVGSALAVLRGDVGPEVPDDALFAVTPRTPIDEAEIEAAEDEIRSWESEGMRVLSVLDDAYPVNLRTIHNRPPLVFVSGTMAAEDERSIAVVGTRAATPDGLEAASRVASKLSLRGYVVVSGLADGIDTAAHCATLDVGGRTVAVIGTGLRHQYPAKNAELQRELAERSAVLSQFWPDHPPTRRTFPMRNIVMSGFAQATVVIEASHTSGARMQARFALEHGRPVFLLDRLLEHAWAREYSQRPGAYVVSSSDQIAEHLERLTASDPFAVA
jgi:DNA processing protein